MTSMIGGTSVGESIVAGASQLDGFGTMADEQKKDSGYKAEDDAGLISAPADAIVMPGSGAGYEEQKSLSESAPIEGNITGKEVKHVILPEDDSVKLPNYVIHFPESEKITIFQRQALLALKEKDPQLQIASLYISRGNKMLKIGEGDPQKLNMVLPTVINIIFDNKIRVFKDVQNGVRAEEVKRTDISKLRLKL